MAMYKRSLEALINTPPNLQRMGQRCIGDFQFRKANYSYKIAPCVSTRTNASCATYVIIRK